MRAPGIPSGKGRVAVKNEFVAHVVDLLGAFGPVSPRRMFGGYGIFRDGLMFGLIVRDTLFLKADARNRADFEAAGMAPFAYQRGGQDRSLSYYEAPPEAMEDVDELARWAGTAFAAALAADRAKARKARH